jgi:hypothetical protein
MLNNLLSRGHADISTVSFDQPHRLNEAGDTEKAQAGV